MLPPHLLTECLGKHFSGIRAYPEDAVPNILHSGVILKMLLLTFLHPSILRGCYCKHSQGITQQMETRQQRPSSSRKCYYRHSSGITWADNGNINRNFEHLTCIQSSQSLPYMRGRGGAGSLGLLNVLHMQKHQNMDVHLEFGLYSQWVMITRIKLLPLEHYFTIYLSTFLSSYKGGRSCKRKGIHFRRACSLHQD